MAGQREQGRADLGAGARVGRPRRHHLPGAVPPGQRVRRAAAGLLRAQGRRPGDPAHAHGPRASGHHAGLRPARGRPLPGVRRVQRQRLRDQDRRLGQPGPDHDGRVLPQRQPHRPQGQGRRGGRRGTPPGPGGRQGAGVAAPPGPVRVEDPDGRGPGLLRGRDAAGSTAARSWTRCRCRPRRRCSSCTPRGTTGRPKGAQHSTGGYLSYVAGTSKYYQDIHPDDTYWCMADIGWITGHSYIVYGPLALGTTSVIYEGTPNYPDAGRPWRIAERLGREHLPHLADRHPDAAQGRPGRAAPSTTTTSST